MTGGGFGIESGFVISTGNVIDIGTPGANPYTDLPPTGVAGDIAQLDIVVNCANYAAADITFQYIFASKEMPVYGGKNKADAFELDLVNEAGVKTPYAFLPGVNGAQGPPVYVDSLTPSATNRATDSKYFVNNPTLQHMNFPGYSVLLNFTAPCTPNNPKQDVEMRISDNNDGFWDSAVFVKAKSFALSPITVKADAWASCSKSCGGGTQTRNVTCLRGSLSVASDVCTSRNVPLVPASQACNTAPCPIYSWSSSQWGACSVTCGSGEQTRVNSCVDNAINPPGPVTNVALCTQTPPALNQSCGLPCITYSYKTDSWSACSVTCGSGTQTRAVTCMDNNGLAASLSYCPNNPPATMQTCGVGECVKYDWVLSLWASCTKTCGGGTRSRQVNCTVTTGSTVGAAAACPASAGAQPSSTEPCNEQLCASFSYVTGVYGACRCVCRPAPRPPASRIRPLYRVGHVPAFRCALVAACRVAMALNSGRSRARIRWGTSTLQMNLAPQQAFLPSRRPSRCATSAHARCRRRTRCELRRPTAPSDYWAV